jgi:hypothetical protein
LPDQANLIPPLNSCIAAESVGTSVDREGGRRVVSDLGVDKDEEEEEEEEEWFTADEGVFDKQLGRCVVSPAMLERIKKRKKEIADSEIKSATKLKLQFDLDEVIYVYAIFSNAIYAYELMIWPGVSPRAD